MNEAGQVQLVYPLCWVQSVANASSPNQHFVAIKGTFNKEYA